jgi:ABC-type phosphate/phosphonate transport system substrate-binding protein
MSGLIAALPMYDWPERRDEVDAEWAVIRDRLRAASVDAPEELTRETGDLYDFWRRPNILLSQTCWGPMEDGLEPLVQVVGQPSYDGIEGGAGEFYSSAIVVRRTDDAPDIAAPVGNAAVVPLERLRGLRFAYNNPDSMSGMMGITRDLEALGEGLTMFSEVLLTGGHRKSVRAVADGIADVAVVDCRSWQLAKQYETAAADALQVIGWTAKRKGLPFITAKATSADARLALLAAFNPAQ